MTQDELRRRLGWLVAERRKALGLNKDAAARVAGINRVTWRQVEDKYMPVRDVTYAAIERALDWEPGDVAVALKGGTPRLRSDAPPAAVDLGSGRVRLAVGMLELIRAEYGEEVYRAALDEVERSQSELGSQRNRHSAT